MKLLKPDEFKIEEILAHRVIKPRRGRVRHEYLIKWLGYPPEENSWEPWKNLNDLSRKLARERGMAP